MFNHNLTTFSHKYKCIWIDSKSLRCNSMTVIYGIAEPHMPVTTAVDTG